MLHLFYRVDRRLWKLLEPQERSQAFDCLSRVLEKFRNNKDCQGHLYSIVGHKADFALMLIDPDLNHINQAENAVAASFPGGTLQTIHSYLSMTETSEYITREDDYDRSLREKEGLPADSPVYQQKMQAFRDAMQRYVNERLYPKLPSHRVMCFYPMNKGRGELKNWYSLDFETRKRLMGGHAITGRRFASKVQQLVTGSTGMDQWEWGVTLFADDPVYFKRIVYEMRFDEVSAVYGQFGDFFVGIHLEATELPARLNL